MSNLRRPSIADRTWSSPLYVNTVPISPQGHRVMCSKHGMDLLTPPASPRHSRSSSDLSAISDDSLFDGTKVYPRRESKTSVLANEILVNDGNVNETLACPFKIEILKDQRGRSQTFGYGAWSTVFRATCSLERTSGLVTPPLSPSSSPPLLVAVKQPARKDAKPILASEGRILSYLMTKPEHEAYIVPFYGMMSDSSLVLAAIPLSLEEHIKKSAVTARALRTTWNMSEPVVGNIAMWLDLAQKLVSALSWLHNKALIVHGDIKPGNILLNRLTQDENMDLIENKNKFHYEPIFADFSSAQALNNDPTPNTLSAVTREYTAPELLSSKVLKNPESTATTASDVFSLAVTLLVAATGNTMVYSGSVFQRQAMATQGWMVIQAVKNGPMEEGARVPRDGVVQRVLDRAVLKEGMGRIDAAAWETRIEEVVARESSELR